MIKLKIDNKQIRIDGINHYLNNLQNCINKYKQSQQKKQELIYQITFHSFKLFACLDSFLVSIGKNNPQLYLNEDFTIQDVMELLVKLNIMKVGHLGFFNDRRMDRNSEAHTPFGRVMERAFEGNEKHIQGYKKIFTILNNHTVSIQ